MCVLMSQVCMGWTRMWLVLNVNGTDAGAPDRQPFSYCWVLSLWSGCLSQLENIKRLGGGLGLGSSFVLAWRGRYRWYLNSHLGVASSVSKQCVCATCGIPQFDRYVIPVQWGCSSPKPTACVCLVGSDAVLSMWWYVGEMRSVLMNVLQP